MTTPDAHMDTLNKLLPILAAIISAVALLVGYGYQKSLERDAEARKTRQEIYSHLISNITERNAILGRLLDQSPEYARASPEERPQIEKKLSETGQLSSPELKKNEDDRTEVIASLCLYGTDAAIDAYARYARENTEGKGGDLGELIIGLRRSVYGETHVTAGEADLAIWNETKYVEKLRRTDAPQQDSKE